MGSCYSDTSAPEVAMIDRNVADELRKKIDAIRYDNPPIIRTDDEIMRNYKMVKIIGTGLFSKVYLVKDEKGQKMAVKVIRKQDFAMKDTMQKIIMEKEILKILQNQNILQLYKTIQSDSKLYFFLEYASKGNLLQILNIKIHMNVNEVRVISAQIAEALLYIHSKGIIYGDLKAENVLVDENGFVKLCDFNLSGTQSILNDTIQGTICYIAPEIIEGKKRTRKSDFWSFGVLVHLLFYRRYPFRFNNQTDLFYNIINRNIEPETRELRAPPSLKKFIDDLLCKDFNKRLGNNMQEFVSHPFFANFDWKNYRKNKQEFRYVADIKDLEEVSEPEKNTARIVEELREHSADQKPVYNIEGFTYECGASLKSKGFLASQPSGGLKENGKQKLGPN